MALTTTVIEAWLEDLVQRIDEDTAPTVSDVTTRSSAAKARGRQPARNTKTSNPEESNPTPGTAPISPPTRPLSQLSLDKPLFPVLPPPTAESSSARSGTLYSQVLSSPDTSASAVIPLRSVGRSDWDVTSGVSRETGTTNPTNKSGAKRNRSPVKSPLDLQFATKPLRYEVELPAAGASLSDVDKALIRDLKKISIGHGTIPSAIQSEIQQAVGELDEIEPWMLTTVAFSGRDLTVLQHEFKEIKKILAYSLKCNRLEMSEAAWNIDVHMPLLRLALEGFPTLEAYYMCVLFASSP